MTPFDDLILTASNRAQTRGYLAQLKQRQRAGALEQCKRFLVAPDPGGRRVGSGTATIFALAALLERIRRIRRERTLSADAALANRRVLIIHCGGDSRRLPAYAAQGKVFTPLPCENRPLEASSLFDLILDDLATIDLPPGGGVLVASGDVLLGVTKHHIRFVDDRMIVVAWRTSIERAARHGVFVVDAKNQVTNVLQKPDEPTLRSRGAIDAEGRVMLDLGLLFLSPHVAARWINDARTAGVMQRQPPTIDLYADMLPAIAQCQASVAGDIRGASFLQTLGGAPALHTITVPDSLFFHIGSTRELLESLTSAKTMQAIECKTTASHRTDPKHACLVASILDHDLTIEGRAVIDSCWLTQRATLAGDNVLVGVPRDCNASIDLPRNTGLVCLPVGPRDWAAISFGIDDDFKTSLQRGGTLAGRSLAALPASCWNSGDDPTLWSARLWKIGSATETIVHAQSLLRDSTTLDPASLVSAGEVMRRVNQRRLLDARRAVLREAAFASVARSVRSVIDWPAGPRPAAIPHRQMVHAVAPVRIDLAGGWSDTPPICNEVGGSVVNVAVRLDGAPPISATARLIDQPLVRIRSVDLNKSIDLTNAAEICSHRDPRDWAALPKAALVLSGIAPSPANADLGRWLRTLGGGIELTISSDLPKGSGLGASSILGAVTLACLAGLLGDDLSRELLIARTSALEQMMSTAGGWQDQAGGISPGAKLLTTAPGSMQIPNEQSLDIPLEFWRERVLLYSTGLQRLARDILQNVVWRWLGGGADARRIVQRLRQGALQMQSDLLAGDMDRFAQGVLEYWELKKAIDPGATTPVIDSLIARVKPYLSAWELPGAGGGGFLFLIARNAAAATRVREILTSDPPNTQARFFEATVDSAGLATTIDT